MTGNVRDGVEVIRKQSDDIQRDIRELHERSGKVSERVASVKDASVHISELLEKTRQIYMED